MAIPDTPLMSMVSVNLTQPIEIRQLNPLPIVRGRRQTKKKRKRVGRACIFCQKSHMSCDESRPCKRCVARGCADQCRDPDGKRKRRGRKRKTALPEDGDCDSDEELGTDVSNFGDAPSSHREDIHSKQKEESSSNGIYSHMYEHYNELDPGLQHTLSKDQGNRFLPPHTSDPDKEGHGQMNVYYSSESEEFSNSECDDMVGPSLAGPVFDFGSANHNMPNLAYRSFNSMDDEDGQPAGLTTSTTPMAVPNQEKSAQPFLSNNVTCGPNSGEDLSHFSIYPELINIPSPFSSQICFQNNSYRNGGSSILHPNTQRMIMYEENQFIASPPPLSNFTVGFGNTVSTSCGGLSRNSHTPVQYQGFCDIYEFDYM